MNISFFNTKNSCFIAVIDNFYSPTELADIKQELLSLHEISKLKIYTNNSVSVDDEGNPKQKSSSLFLDGLFTKDRTLSKILSINRKIFTSEELKNKLLEKSLFYNYIYNSNKDSTLVNFYEQTNSYGAHKDSTCFTILSFFELKPFIGGDLLFPEYNIKIKSLENRMVIFPGFLIHAAEEVKSGTRVSMAQFINMV